MQLAHFVDYPPEKDGNNLAPIILLHGMTSSKLSWKIVASRLAALTGRKVYALDARNHGESPWSEDFSIDILVDDLDGFMESESIPKAIVIGHSMGGLTAMTLALKKPEKVEKCVVEDMTIRPLSSELHTHLEQFLMLLRVAIRLVPQGIEEKSAKEAIIDILAKHIPPEQNPSPRGNGDSRLLDLAIKRREDGAYTWSANFDVLQERFNDLSIQLEGQYPGQVLFLYGGKSFMNVKQDEDNIKQLFPKAEFVAVEDAGHNIHSFDVQLFVDTVSKFVDE